MNISKHIQEFALGQFLNYKLYQPVSSPSKDYLIFLHGQGELGPADGSNLDEVEKHGFPKHAKAGFEFPFNMVALQSVTDHRNAVKVLPAYLKLKYGADTVIVTGLSLGGYGTYDSVLTDNLNAVYAIAPVCGSGRIASVANYHSVPAIHFHGANDEVVKLNTAKGFIDKYNSMFDPEIKLIVYPNTGHDAWIQAYSITPGQDVLLQQVIAWFAEARPKSNSVELIKSKIIEYVKTVL